MKEALKLALEMVQTKMFAHAEMYLKEALAQPEQEPVAYLTRRKIGGTEGLLRADMVDKSAKNQETHDFIPLFTFPAQRIWVGLTNEEIQEVAKQARSKDHAVTLTNKLLKEKNT